MSTIIKAPSRAAAPSGVAFNWEDMTRQAQRYLDQVRAEAEGILAHARAQAVAIRQTAATEGREAALADAEKLHDEKLARQLDTLLPALRQAIAGIQDARQACLSHWEQQAIHVSAAIAGRVIRRELVQSPDIPLTLVREALDLAAGSPQVRISLNPADHAALRTQVERLVAEASRLGHAEIVADPAVSPGGCRVETRFGVIDQQFESQLARIEEELA